MNVMNKKKELAAYVRNNIEDFEVRLQLALKRMERMRCSLRFADSMLFDEIADAVSEWCDENEVCYDEVDWDDAIDGEDGIIWQD